ncbi:hypothetical protein GOBAR_AA30866 [Gossypium barbadense]|uniref:Uncharacterized protein n=1 Tax=Gossypium barbadense TaxID=3634 RepID=A0A2P5WFE7_GOSBA|nr:hypothetical protein GOBAR_AA30866 [Gossypium barbadense]
MSYQNTYVGYKLEPRRFRHKLVRLKADMVGMTTNLIETVNSVLKCTRHLPILVVFSAMFYKLATLILRMGLRQVKQMEVGRVYVEEVRKVMEVNTRRARSMNAKLYFQN